MRTLPDEKLYTYLTREDATSGKAFAELYERHSRRIYAYCRTFFRDTEQVEDMFQETFTRFYDHARKGAEVRNVRAYLMTMARNQCINAKRNARPTVTYEDYHQIIDHAPHESREMMNLVEMALDLLADEQREAFFLHEIDGLSYPEIADLLGVTQTAIRIRVYRARKAIRKILQPYLTEIPG